MSSNKQSNKYFDAKNIRVVATDQKSTFALTNEAGNKKILSIPIPSVDIFASKISYKVELEEGSPTSKELVYSTNNTDVSHIVTSYSDKTSLTQTIIGVKELRDSAIIITTDNNGFDCFWELLNLNNDNFDLNLLYMGNLGLSSDNLIQILYNYENSIIQKIYFADGVNQLRFFNIRQSTVNGDSINLIDLDPSAIDVVSQFKLSQPTIEVSGGGSHTSGMIQHAYNLYVLNGSQTTISPLSELIPIAKEGSLGGGEVNEVLGRSVNVNIPNIDSKFTHIKIYSIKYTSYNENPEITVVADKEIDNFKSFSFTDTGNAGTTISIDAFIFLGSNPIIPKHIISKDNRLFPINIKEKTFEVELDFRAYSFNSSGYSRIVNAPYYNNGTQSIDINNQRGQYTQGLGSDMFSKVPLKSDSINSDYDEYKYQLDGSTYGASGKYIDLEITQTYISDLNKVSKLRLFKDNELYRIAIKFYNRLGQVSSPLWVADLRIPEGNMRSRYNQLKVNLTNDFYTWINNSSNFSTEDDVPVGYKIIRADRTLTDQTIHSQGLINPMVSNIVTTDDYSDTTENRFSKIKELVNTNKATVIPSVIRLFENLSPFGKCQDYLHTDIQAIDSVTAVVGPGKANPVALTGHRSSNQFCETPRLASSADWRARNIQNTKVMQFFSPEVLFRDNPIDSSYKLRVVGLRKQDEVACLSTEVNPISRVFVVDITYNNGINYDSPNIDVNNDIVRRKGSRDNVSHDYGFFSIPSTSSSGNENMENQLYRSFLGNFSPHTNEFIYRTGYGVYGTPELTQEGADFTFYNGDPNVKYCNNLKTMLIDKWGESDRAGKANRQIRGSNTIGAKCYTFMLGEDDSSFPMDRRPTLEKLHEDSGVSETEGILIAEFIKDPRVLYIGNIYGGMTYESKKSSSYIDIGTYQDIFSSEVFIESPGDTFVDTFTFAKMAKTPVENKSKEFCTVSEIVSIRIESTVDLKNRNDLSLTDWDSKYQPHYADYVKYNKVYSQQPNLIKSVGLGSKFKKLEEFDGRIMSSKEKIPGEFVDSWTDFLENETMDLDGKYGPINAVISLRDEIFCLQDTGVAQIAVNPRAQVQAKDGISLELGVGGILHDYKYLSTTTGCLNKWGVVSSESAFYFVDVINKGIMTFDGRAVGRMSDLKGFHHEFLNKFNYEDIRNDNSVSGTGLSAGYNPVNSDVYFSFHQSEGNDSFTIRFSEKTGEFMSYVDYVPSWYINKGSVLITTNKENDQVWEHFKGKPNHFYGDHFPSSITFHAAPKGNEIIMNSASFAMELTDLTGAEVLNKGLTGVRVYNDYQDSGLVDLKLRTNIWKKFRNWKLNFPRNAGTRDRVRGMWAFTEFEFKNPEGNKLILHDITTFYTQP